MKMNLFVTFKNEDSLKFPKHVEPFFLHKWNEQIIKAKERNSLLFNGPLAHVKNWVTYEDTLHLHLGLTDYKSYVCTREREFKNMFPDIQAATPLAVCAAIITTDRKIIVEQRKGVDIYDGFFHVAGGFLDPENDLYSDGIPDPVKCIVREVKEEVGLDVSSDSLILLGLAEDTIVPHYELCYLTYLNISSDEVKSNFEMAETDGEFNNPIFIDFTIESINAFLATNKDRISATGKECLIMALNNKE
jgi:8-oxo-dGTP pyrophosphatase MutT (NUDIX family)